MFPTGLDDQHVMNNLFSEPIPTEAPFIIPFVTKKIKNNIFDDTFDDLSDLFDEDYDYDDDDEINVFNAPITSAHNYPLMYSEGDTYR